MVVDEDIFYSFDDLVKLSSLGVQPGGLARPLSWAQGVLFKHQSMPPTDEIVREQLEGKVHWNSVEWALMPKYKNVILIQDINAKIPVIDVSANVILSDVAIALKKKASV